MQMLLAIVISVLALGLAIYNRQRMMKMKKEVHSISLMDLSEFDNLSPKVKQFYKVFVLESWMKLVNEAVNSEYETRGIDEYYKLNKDKLLKLNGLYVDIMKEGMKRSGGMDETFKVLLYNADLDTLIREAEARKVELTALNSV
tara:strand:+ start:7354 stop:7785 length:432 start_codon:yes stop_codon:yes gene_type:complete